MNTTELNSRIEEAITERLMEAKQRLAKMNILKSLQAKMNAIDEQVGAKFYETTMYLLMSKPEITEMEVVAEMYSRMR